MSAMLGLISYLSYPGASEKATKFTVSVLLIYTSILPILTFVSDITDGEELNFIEEIRQEADAGLLDEEGKYITVSEEAIKDGIRKLIFAEYGVAPEDIEIYLHGFDFKEMRADRVKIILRGTGALSDYRGIEDFVNSLEIGECEVNIEFG